MDAPSSFALTPHTPLPILAPLPPSLSQLLASASPPSPPPSWLPPFLHPLYGRLSQLPVVEFYAHLYRTSPVLFFSTLFTNWLLPIVLEALPWYLSRRALSKLLRDSRNAIQHRLISADPFPPSSLLAFATMSLMYSLLHTLEELLRSRLLLLNRLVIRRLVMERILYSEVGSLQQRYAAMFGGEKSVGVRTDRLELLVFTDIHETLQLFNSTIPHLFRSTYTLLLSTSDLWQQRAAIDVLSILRPSIVGFSSELLNLLRDRLLLDPQTVALQRNANEHSTFISNIVDGLSEVQVNNMQPWAMDRLSRLSEDEVMGKQGWATFVSSVYRVAQGRGVLDFVSEVYVVKTVMERRGISHEEYSKVQNDIDYVSRLVGRIYGLMRESWRIFDTQQRVMAVLHLPSFIREQGRTSRRRRTHRTATASRQPTRSSEEGQRRHGGDGASNEEFDFHDLTVHRLWFRYACDQPWALKIGPQPDGVDDSNNADEEKERDRVDERNGRGEEHIAHEGGEDTGMRSPSSSPHRPPAALRFDRGKTYAIIGRNRSGKSTLMEILCKLHLIDPSTNPIITLNSSLAASCASSSCPADSSFLSLPRVLFRSVLSYVPQRPFIFPGTIEENVRMGDTNATAAEVEAAAEAAGLFLYDQEEERRKTETRQQPAIAKVEWKGEVRKKPWEVNRMGDLLWKAWGWAKTAWEWHWGQLGDELDEEDEEVWGGGFHMTDEVALDPATRPHSLPHPLTTITSPSKRPPSLSPPAHLDQPFAPSSPDAPPLPYRSSSSPLSTAAPSSHPVLSLECQEGGSNLSGGFAQSVALSRVFLRPSSQVVILDEAMGAMDPIKKVEWIVPRLMDWVRQHGQTLLVVTHDVRLICPLVDCVYVMEHGRMILSGSHAELMERHAQPYCRMFGEA